MRRPAIWPAPRQGGCSGAWTSSSEAHPGRGLSGARVQVLPWLPRGPQKFALVSSDLPIGPGGRCKRHGWPPSLACVFGTAAGGPPGGPRVPQSRSDGGYRSGGAGQKSPALNPAAPAPTQHPPEGGGLQPLGAHSGKLLRARVRRAGSARAAGGDGGAAVSPGCFHFEKAWVTVPVLPGPGSHSEPPSQGSDAKLSSGGCY